MGCLLPPGLSLRFSCRGEGVGLGQETTVTVAFYSLDCGVDKV